MRRISILAIIALLLLVAEIVIGFVTTWNSERGAHLIEKRMTSIEKPVDGAYYASTVKLNVYPLDKETAEIGEAYNLESQCAIPVIANKMDVGCWLPRWFKIVEITSSLVAFPFLIWGIVSLVKLLLSVRKQHIFTRKNAKRLRVFVYGCFGSIALIQMIEWISYRIASKQIVLDNFGISGFYWEVSWSDVITMALIAEIFALGVKLQEEQELTI